MGAVRLILAPLLALLVAAPSALATVPPSVNDNRADALPLSSDQFSAIDTTPNTTESGEPNTGLAGSTGSGCQPAGGTTNGALIGVTEWYTVLGSGGPITITTDESTPTVSSQSTSPHVDTVVFVYPQGSNTAIACNDDISTDQNSTVTFSSSAGQGYDIQVGSFAMPSSGQSPEGGLIVTAERPVNDTRSFPTTLSVAGGPVSASNNAATTDAGETLACQRPNGTIVPYSRTVWFRFHATGAGEATFSAAATGSLDPVEAVYSGAPAAPLGCDDGQDASLPGTTSVTVPVSAGDYLVQVGAPSGARGSWAESVVFAAASTTTLISSTPRAHVGRPLTYVASVTPVPSAGAVAFTDHGTTIAGCGAVAVDPNTGNATCDVSYPSVGTHSIVATYAGAGPGNPGFASSPLSEVVAFAKTATSLSLSHGSERVGRRVTVTVRVAPAPVGGQVAIFAGTKALRGCGAPRLNPGSGVARCTFRLRTRGKLSLRARFSGSAGYGRSSSRKRTLLAKPRQSTARISFSNLEM